MSDRLQTLNEIKSGLQEARTQITRAETQKEALTEKLNETKARMEALGVTPENILEKKAALEAKFDTLAEESMKSVREALGSLGV